MVGNTVIDLATVDLGDPLENHLEHPIEQPQGTPKGTYLCAP